MANEIKDKYAAVVAMTITLASLASSATKTGRQSTLVDNTTNRYQRILLSLSIKLGTSPTGNRGVYIYLIRSNNDSTPIITDLAGASDAAWTQLNAPNIGTLLDKLSPSTGDVLADTFLIEAPGPKWGIGIFHDTGVNFDSTGGNHVVSFIGLDPEIQ